MTARWLTRVLAILLPLLPTAVFADPCPKKAVYPYPLVFQPHSSTLGISVWSFSGWRYQDKRWERIPLQVDQVNKRGEYVLTEGIPFTANTDDGAIDANDEMVVSGRSLGEDFSRDNIPDNVSKSAAGMWKIDFCNKGTGYGTFLLVANPEMPSQDKQPPAKLNLEEKQIESSRYRYLFQKENPILLGNVWLKNQTGTEQALFADSSFRLAFHLPWWLPNITLTDKNFKSSIESWQEGPVRTIVAVGVKMREIFSIFNLHMFSELVFYDDFFQIPTVMEFPMDTSSYLQKGSGLAYAIRFADPNQWKVESNVQPLPAGGVGALSNTQNGDSRRFWTTIEGPAASLVMQANLKGASDKTVLPAPYWIQKPLFEDPNAQKHWPWLKDFHGDTGVFVDISEVQKGIYNFSLDLLIDSKADEGIHELFTSPKADWVTLSLR